MEGLILDFTAALGMACGVNLFPFILTSFAVMAKNKALSYLLYVLGVGVAVLYYFFNIVSPLRYAPAASWVLSAVISAIIIYYGHRELRKKYPETYFENEEQESSDSYNHQLSNDIPGYQKKPAGEDADERVVPTILYCRKCGAKLMDGSLFCNKCGTKVMQPIQSESFITERTAEKQLSNPESNDRPTSGWKYWKDILGL